MKPRVAIIGASGFVGGATATAFRHRGYTVVPVPAPRLTPTSNLDEVTAHLIRQLRLVDTVVNAAGLADATGKIDSPLYWANSVLPGVIGQATHALGARFVQVSSAAVQGRRACLDDSLETQPGSPYSRSKATGERLALNANPKTVIYRPPGVHGPSRSVTLAISRLAASSLATVAAPGTANTPQALITNVADAIAFLATHPDGPPSVVHHPSEGLTTTRLMELLGGRKPRLVPAHLARMTVNTSFVLARREGLWGHARRLELLWFGQEQARSWLESAGWTPPDQHDVWTRLAHTHWSNGHRSPK